MRFTGCSLSETEHSYLLPATHHLSDELCGFCLPTHGQQGQAKVKHHKLLHGGEVLLTEPGVLHQHQRLEAAAALQHRMGMAHVSAGTRKKQQRPLQSTHVSVASQLPPEAASCNDIALGHVEDAAVVGQKKVCSAELVFKQDLHTSTYSMDEAC